MAERSIVPLDRLGTSLNAFAAEPPSLADLQASDFPIDWHEAVAIVLETCRALAVRPMAAGEVLPSNVRIDDTGTVTVLKGGITDGPTAVTKAGGLLRDLLRGGEPVPLRLVMSQALANPPLYTSLEAFSQALIYFERPDRPAIIRGVCHRWESRVVGVPTTAPSADEPRKKPEPTPERRAEPMRSGARTSTRPVVWSALLLLLAVNIAAGLTIWKRWSGSIGDVSGAADATSAGKEIGGRTKAAADASAKPTTPLPRARPVARSENRVTGDLPKPRTAPPAQLIEPRPQTLSSFSFSSILPRDPLAVWETPAVLPARGSLSANAANPASVVPVIPPGTGADPSAFSRVYSAVDTDVVEPVVVYPNLPSAGVMPLSDDALVFDIVVGRSGAVESVKLRRAPASIRDAIVLTMSLSAAKAWRFQPATRNGLPVRYLKSIWLPKGYSY